MIDEIFSTILGKTPLFLILSLTVSYFMWSKFLNKGKLKPNLINSYFDLIAIFINISLTLVMFSFLFLIFQESSHLNYNPQSIFSPIPLLVSFLSVMLILSLLVIYRNKKGSKKDLKTIFTRVIQIYLVSISLFIGGWFALITSNLRPAFWDIIFLLFFLFLAFALFCIITHGVLFKLDFTKIITKKFCKLLISSILIAYLLLLTFLPITFYGEPAMLGYEIHNPKYSTEAFNIIEVPISIKSFGLIGSAFPIISMKYSNYGIDLNNSVKENFEIKINSSTLNGDLSIIKSTAEIKEFNSKSDKPLSILGIISQENRGVINLLFNEFTVKKEKIKGIVFVGTSKINISAENFSYTDNIYLKTCSENECIINFEIHNNLTSPVFIKTQYGYSEPIVNIGTIGIKNVSLCNLSSISSRYDNKNPTDYIFSQCTNNDCFFEINRPKSNDLVNTRFGLDNAGNLRRDYLQIYSPTNINITLTINC